MGKASKGCETKYCRNDAVSGRVFCAKCRSRRYKKRHPFRYHFNALKQNAKRRGKSFSLSFKEFKQLWQQHPEKWTIKKGPGECKWQMDRIDNTKGYKYSNIQIITKQKNIDKYIQHDRFQMDVYWKEKNGQQRLDLNKEAPF